MIVGSVTAVVGLLLWLTGYVYGKRVTRLPRNENDPYAHTGKAERALSLLLGGVAVGIIGLGIFYGHVLVYIAMLK